jgi:YesN/AraC family two-component response regulator
LEIGIRDLVLKPDTVEELGRTLHRVLTERKQESLKKVE